MIVLWHEESSTSLYIPSGIGEVEPGPFKKHSKELPRRKLLVLMDPLTWLSNLYLTSGAPPQEFRSWYKNTVQAPQSSICPEPDAVIRSEFYPVDIYEELGIYSTMIPYKLPPRKSLVSICPATRMEITRKYKQDYLLGEYLETCVF